MEIDDEDERVDALAQLMEADLRRGNDGDLIDCAAAALFNVLVEECDGDHAHANKLYTQLVLQAFAEHLDEDSADHALICEQVNSILSREGTRYRLMRLA